MLSYDKLMEAPGRDMESCSHKSDIAMNDVLIMQIIKTKCNVLSLYIAVVKLAETSEDGFRRSHQLCYVYNLIFCNILAQEASIFPAGHEKESIRLQNKPHERVDITMLQPRPRSYFIYQMLVG